MPPISPKKTSPKTSAAADPKRKKSYHSVAVPIRLAKTTLTIDRLPGSLPVVGAGTELGGHDGFLSVVLGTGGIGGHAAVQPPSRKNAEPVIEPAVGPQR